MRRSLDDVPCAGFEANIFAGSLCQHCLRAAGAHRHADQEHAVEVAGRSGGPEAEPGGPWDAVRIVAPRCEVYVCVGRADGRHAGSRAGHGPRSAPEPRASTEKPAPNPKAVPKAALRSPSPQACCPHCRDLPCLVSQDWEMTRLWDSSLGSGKRDAMSHGGRKDEARAPQADRPRWAQPLPSGSWVRTEAPSCRKEICPLKAARGPATQKPEESRAKPRTGSCRFSLDHPKPDPPRAPSPSPRGRGSSLTPGRLLASSSRPGEPHGHPGGAGTEGRRGLERQEYTVLADLPKPKRLGRGDAAERCGSRTLSPGRVEVERIFGCERRKSETLEAFQALEEGRVERLDGKTPLPPSKGRLGRRQSSPSLPREGQRLSWHPEQRSRDPKELRRSPSPARLPERTGAPLRPVCPSHGRRGTGGSQGTPRAPLGSWRGAAAARAPPAPILGRSRGQGGPRALPSARRKTGGAKRRGAELPGRLAAWGKRRRGRAWGIPCAPRVLGRARIASGWAGQGPHGARVPWDGRRARGKAKRRSPQLAQHGGQRGDGGTQGSLCTPGAPGNSPNVAGRACGKNCSLPSPGRARTVSGEAEGSRCAPRARRARWSRTGRAVEMASKL
eukprot:XP_027306155.1 fibril-forming collagen alpha chain-like [Anas platyrhynchos]